MVEEAAASERMPERIRHMSEGVNAFNISNQGGDAHAAGF
jgi:hypothetical protein